MTGIYKITSPSGKIYIGQSIDIDRRKLEHKSCNEKSKLYSSIQKYGFENHIFEIEEECPVELLNERERYWQDFYNVLGENGLNLVLQDSNELPKVYSSEVRENMRLGQLGQKQSKETVEKRISKTIGKKRSKEFSKIMSDLGKSRVYSEKAKENFRQSQLNLYRNGYISPRGRRIINTETGEIFNSISSLSKVIGICHATLRNNLEGINKKNKYPNLKYYKDE